MKTTYSIFFCNPQKYRSELYPCDASAFEGYTAVGRQVMDRTFEEISQYMATGSFPAREIPNNDGNNQIPVGNTPVPTYTSVSQAPQPVNYAVPVVPQNIVPPESMTAGPATYFPESRTVTGADLMGNTAPSVTPSEMPIRPVRRY